MPTMCNSDIINNLYLEYFSQKNGPQRFAFGRDLHLLPQQQLSEMGGTVPQYV